MTRHITVTEVLSVDSALGGHIPTGEATLGQRWGERRLVPTLTERADLQLRALVSHTAIVRLCVSHDVSYGDWVITKATSRFVGVATRVGCLTSATVSKSRTALRVSAPMTGVTREHV
jgi:hypothetical protein